MTKKILITGINGFIGSHCKSYYEEKGYEVFGIDIFGSKSKNTLIEPINIKSLNSFNIQFDYIIHLAGSGSVGMAEKDPLGDLERTINSTKTILEFCIKNNLNTKVVYSSSAAVYGNNNSLYYKEDDNKNPISVYGENKLEAEKICKKYSDEFGLNISIIRFFSIYGEGLKKQLLWDISNKIKNLPNNDTLNCFGTGNELRDFIHVKDAVNFINLTLEKNSLYSIYNCGTGISTSVQDIIKLLANQYNFSGKISFNGTRNLNDPEHLVANIKKSEIMGFLPKINIDEGIQKYAKWFKETT